MTKDKYQTPTGGPSALRMFSVIPSEAELEACWEEARQATDDGGRNVVRESAVDLEMNLLKEAKRFIVVDEIHHPAAWPRDDSYGKLFLFLPLYSESSFSSTD